MQRMHRRHPSHLSLAAAGLAQSPPRIEHRRLTKIPGEHRKEPTVAKSLEKTDPKKDRPDSASTSTATAPAKSDSSSKSDSPDRGPDRAASKASPAAPVMRSSAPPAGL